MKADEGIVLSIREQYRIGWDRADSHSVSQWSVEHEHWTLSASHRVLSLNRGDGGPALLLRVFSP